MNYGVNSGPRLLERDYTGTHYKIKSSNPAQVCGSGPFHCNDIAMHAMRSPAGVGDGGQTRRMHGHGLPPNKFKKSRPDLWLKSF